MALLRAFTAVRQLFAEPQSTGFLALSSVHQHRDCLKVASQQVNWTFLELQRHSLAYAEGLREMGVKPGDKVATWVARADGAEHLAVQIACARLGAQVLSCTNEDQLSTVLAAANVLVFSPWANSRTPDQKRVDTVISLVPETRMTHWGTPLRSAAFPQLRSIIQLGFSTIRGMVKAKQVAVYRGSPSDFPEPKGAFFASPAATITFEGLAEAGKLAQELGLDKGTTLLNTVHPKHGVSLYGTVGALSCGARVVIPGSDKRFGRLAASQRPSVLLLDRMGDFSQCPEVDTLVVAETSQSAVETLLANLRSAHNLRAKRVVGLNSQTLTKV